MKTLLGKINKKLDAQGGFLKSVSVLAGGTAFAQILSIAILPLLTRLYTPENFSVLAVYSSILAILAVISCLRLEIAIPLPEKDEDAVSLMVLACISNIIFFILLLVVIIVNYDYFLFFLKAPIWRLIIWLIPIGVFFSGFYNILQYWVTRQKNFRTIAKTRMTQSLGGSFVQVISGLMGKGGLGLVIGQIINVTAGIGVLLEYFRKESQHLLKAISVKNLISIAKQYDKFPKYSTFEALANNAAIQLPVVIIAFVYVGAKAGYLMLAMKIMGVPISLIGNAVSQVYLAHAPSQHSSGQLKKYTVQTIMSLLKIIIVPFLCIGVLSPILFPIVFGKEWFVAGNMVVWMLPWFFMQMLSSPVSMSLYVVGKQKTALMLQCFGLFLRVGGVLVFVYCFNDYVFEYYAVSGFVFYGIYLAVILNLLNKCSVDIEIIK